MHVALRGAEHPVPGFADPQHVARAAGVAQPGESPEPGSRPSRRGCPARGQPGYAFGTSCSREAPVVVGPGDERAAGAGGRGYSYVRASHADREQVIDVLKAAFVQGRLAKDELDLRLGRVLASRTYADLSALTADLPVRLTRAQPPEPVRQSGSQKPGIDQPGSQKPGIDQPGSGACPGIERTKDNQGVGLRDGGATEPGSRCGTAELRNGYRHDRDRRGPVRLCGGRAGQRADDVALVARESAPAARGMIPGIGISG